MKKLGLLFLILLSVVAIGAGSIKRFQENQLMFGSTSALIELIFDYSNDPSSAKISVDPALDEFNFNRKINANNIDLAGRLEVASITAGSTPCPVMTEAQRDAIVGHAEGDCVYDSTNKSYSIFDGTDWIGVGGGLDKWTASKNIKNDNVIWEPASLKIYKADSDFTTGGTFNPANWTELSNFPLEDILTASASGNMLVTDTELVEDVYRKDHNLRFIEDFKQEKPSEIYVVTGTGSVLDNEVSPLDGVRSASVTVASGNAGTRFTSPVRTNLKPSDYQLLGLVLDWKLDVGQSGDFQLVIEESDDGVVYTKNSEMIFPVSDEVVSRQLNFKLKSSTSHYRYYIELVREELAAVAEWDNIKIITRPMQTSESVEVNSVSLVSNDGRSITAATEDLFFSGTGNGWFSGADGTDSYYEIQGSNTIISLSGNVYYNGGTSGLLYVYKNGSAYKIISGYNGNDRNRKFEFISKAGEFLPGDKISVRNLSVTNSLTVDVNNHWMNIVESKSSNNVVFQGQGSDLDTNSYNPVFEGVTPAALNAKWRRTSGNTLQGFITLDTSAVDGNNLSVSLPTGYTVDSSIDDSDIELGSWTQSGTGGGVEIFGSAQSGKVFCDKSVDDTKLYLGAFTFGAGGPVFNKSAGNSIFNSGARISIVFEVPVNELKSSDVIYSVPVTNEVENTYSGRVQNNGTASMLSEKYAGTLLPTRTNQGRVTVNFANLNLVNIPKIDLTLADGALALGTINYSNITNTSVDVISFNNSGGYSDFDFNIGVEKQNSDVKAPQGYFLGNMPRTAHTTGGAEYKTADTWNGKPIYARSYESIGSFSSVFTLDTIDTGLIVIEQICNGRKASNGIWFSNYDTTTTSMYLEHNDVSGALRVQAAGNTYDRVISTIKYIKP